MGAPLIDEVLLYFNGFFAIRKGEEILNILYWYLIHHFVKQNYRIIKLSESQNEIWLESFQHKAAPLIRIVRYDVDWSSWLQRDIEYTGRVVEQLRKRHIMRSARVLNIYVTTYPPVDDWEFLIAKPLTFDGKNETVLHTIVLHQANVKESLQKLSEMTATKIEVSDFAVENESFDELEQLKQKTLFLAREQIEKEKQLFEYGKPFFTYLFIVAQVLMFLFLEWKGGSTNTRVLIEYGAKFNPLIKQGEWWRFLTPVFLHIGFFHLLMNTFALYYLGTTVERLYGSFRFFIIYLFAGFFGTLASFLFTSSVSAGASGAIFGLFGALLYFGTVYRHLFMQTMGMNILSVIGINLLFGFIVPGIDNAGHIGGLIGGFLAASIVHLPKHRFVSKQLVSLALIVFLVTAGIYSGLHKHSSEDVKVTIGLAQHYIEKERYERAYRLLKSIDDADIYKAEVDFLLSYIQIKRGNIVAAKQYLLSAVKTNPRFHEAFYNLALVYLDLKEYTNAEKAAEVAVNLHPENEKYKQLLSDIKRFAE
jgi:rhomboid protease GluP